MTMEPYRRVLALPGVRALMLLGLFARIPATAAGMALTLHVVKALDLSYAAAGTLGAVVTVGMAVSGPVAGRMVDRHGLRPVLLITTAAQALFWFTAPSLPYQLLIFAAAVNGLLAIPMFGIIRQCLAAMVPTDQRRTGFALDSMAVELSYMVGPAVAVLAVTSFGGPFTLYAVGAGMVASGVALLLLNPPVRSIAEQAEKAVVVPRRQWLKPRMFLLLGISAATTFVLSTTELAVVGKLDVEGTVAWAGLVIAVWCVYSLIGGFVYGAMHRTLSPLFLIGGMAALTIPLGLVGGGWWWLSLALIPAGLLTAPSLAATVDTMSKWVPASARGEAMGLHGTALTLGIAAGAPFAGFMIDQYGASWAFVAAGGIGLLVVLAAVPLWKRTADASEPAAVPVVPAESPTKAADRTFDDSTALNTILSLQSDRSEAGRSDLARQGG